MTTFDQSLPIGDRIRIAYQAARARSGAWDACDKKFAALNGRLGAIQGELGSGLPGAARQALERQRVDLLEDAEEFFVRVRDADERDLACALRPPSPRSPLLSVDFPGMLLAELERGGISVEVRGSRLAVSPAKSLTASQRDRLFQFKKEIIAEIERRRDVEVF